MPFSGRAPIIAVIVLATGLLLFGAYAYSPFRHSGRGFVTTPATQQISASTSPADSTVAAASSTSAPTTSSQASPTVPWKTFTSAQYRFSIDYPCAPDDGLCHGYIGSPDGPRPRPAFTHDSPVWGQHIDIPTRADDPHIGEEPVIIYAFTDTSVRDFNAIDPSSDYGPGQFYWAKFPFDLDSMQMALALPFDTVCSVRLYESASTTPCRIVALGGQKAVATDDAHFRELGTLGVNYFVYRGDNTWVMIAAHLGGALAQAAPQLDTAIKQYLLTGKPIQVPSIQDFIDTQLEVVNTIRFF